MNRAKFITTMAMAGAASVVNLKTLGHILNEQPSREMQPALFIGHGSPMNVIQDNTFTRRLLEIGKNLPKPKAILVISAHWYTKGSWVSTNPFPQTIYDFGGFPKELYEIKYPAPGSPEYADILIKAVEKVTIQSDHEMGLDHGAWTILHFLFPNANVPVFQMSMDYTKGPAYHYELGKELLELRKKGVMIIGSGNIVHNLRAINWNEPNGHHDWALEFDNVVKDKLSTRDHTSLINYDKLGKAAMLSVPSNDHYLPMMYILGLQQKNEEVVTLHEGFEMGSISQRAFIVG